MSVKSTERRVGKHILTLERKRYLILGWFTVAQLGSNLGPNLGPNLVQVGNTKLDRFCKLDPSWTSNRAQDHDLHPQLGSNFDSNLVLQLRSISRDSVEQTMQTHVNRPLIRTST